MNEFTAGGENLDNLLDRLEERTQKVGVEEYEIYLVRIKSLTIGVKEARTDQVRRTEESSAAFRFVDRRRLGFGYTSVFTPEAVERAVSEASAGAKLTDPQPGLGLPQPPDRWPGLDVFDPELARIPLTDKLAKVREMEAAALNSDRRVEKVRQAEYREGEVSIRLVNSHGLRYRHQGTLVTVSLMTKAAEGSEAEMGYEFDFARRFRELNFEAVGREAAGRAVRSLGGRKAVGGRRPVILENRVAAEFLDILAASFLADNVQKGKSTLAGRLGRKIMAPGVSLIDDGLYPLGLATSPGDAEGTPSQKTVLVDQGVLSSFLYDYSHARVDGLASTGNAERSGPKSPPGIEQTNLYLAPGSKSFKELCQALGEGLLVSEVMGVHTADPISGDFSFGLTGVWLKNGQPDHPVKGMALAGNIFRMFDQAVEIGSDLKYFGSTGAPSLLIGELSVSGL